MFNDWMKKISELKDSKSVTWGECPNGVEKIVITDVEGIKRIDDMKENQVLWTQISIAVSKVLGKTVFLFFSAVTIN